jgi:hypothetical protein
MVQVSESEHVGTAAARQPSEGSHTSEPLQYKPSTQRASFGK